MKLSFRSILFILGFIIISSGILLYLFYPFENFSNTDTSKMNNFSFGIADSIKVKTDRVLYQKGNVLIINGIIKGTDLFGYVELNITDSIGRIWHSNNYTLINTDIDTALFSTVIGTILENETSGVYQIHVKYGNIQNMSSFFISTLYNIRSEIIDVHLQSLVGKNITIIKTGDTVMVVGTVFNLQKDVETVSFNVEIRNGYDVLVHSGFISTNISSGESRILSVGWPAAINGTYTVYAYAKENFENPMIISNIVSMTFDVIQ